MILLQADNEKDKSSFLVLVIEPDNLERMKTADPITLRPQSVGGFIQPIKYPANFGVLVAFESDVARLYELRNDAGALVEYLSRGYKFNSLDGVRVSAGDKVGSS
jgi:hypothetical protein